MNKQLTITISGHAGVDKTGLALLITKLIGRLGVKVEIDSPELDWAEASKTTTEPGLAARIEKMQKEQDMPPIKIQMVQLVRSPAVDTGYKILDSQRAGWCQGELSAIMGSSASSRSSTREGTEP